MARHSDTLESVLARAVNAELARQAPEQNAGIDYAQYQREPVQFCLDILGFQPWSRQAEVITALATYPRVTVTSGHKTGKSTGFAAGGLHAYCCFPGARVRLTASIASQIDDIIWREIKRMHRWARVPLPGSLAQKAFTGLSNPINFSEIKGRAAGEPEGVAGFSGGKTVVLVDEASGVEDSAFEAMLGNRMGGNATLGLISNPTRDEGEFYESHHRKRREILGKDGYYAIRISSRESPNVTGEWRDLKVWEHELEEWVPRSEPIPGLAMPDEIDSLEREYGKDSPQVLVRVEGRFAIAEESKAFSRALVEAAQARYADTPPEGRLYVGLDPAGEGGQGDDSALVTRRGKRVLHVEERRGLTPEQHLEWVMRVLQEARCDLDTREDSLPIVVIDSAGDVGARVHAVIKAEAMRGRRFWVVKSRGSDRDPKTMRQPKVYTSHRDELAASAREWMRGGGAIPKHTRLEEELRAGSFLGASIHNPEQLRFTPKDELRKTLGRSPDVADAFFLCCWVPRFAMKCADAQRVQAAEVEQRVALARDPYSAQADTSAHFSDDPYLGNPYG